MRQPRPVHRRDNQVMVNERRAVSARMEVPVEATEGLEGFEGELFADWQAGFAGTAITRGAQDLQDGVHEIGLGEGGLLQVIPGIERLHDAAVDGRRHDARDPV